MKKIFILVIGVLLIAVNLYAAGDLIVEGNVGIGTNSPEGKAHLKYSIPPGTVLQKSFPFGLLVETDNQVSGAIGFKSVYAGGHIGYGRLTYDADNARFNFWSQFEGDYNVPASFGVPVGGMILWGGVSAPGYITRDNQGIKIVTGEDMRGIYLQTQSDNTQNVFVPYGNVGVGTTTPTEKLEIAGRVKAQEFVTGDITFQKDGESLWRMFEDKEGLYLESVKTGKIYRFVLQEVKRE